MIVETEIMIIRTMNTVKEKIPVMIIRTVNTVPVKTQ